ncbi:MAG: hypothetical protein Unbinned5081contig1001_1 [Prokaryotic dsDNA virus sp.]|nr:MAG: hypothetical protein Unbinned5081contig1001_1 [Prokaryotic dsDNA virus sp.]|tara:strand:+ start:3995 stop:4414 length:420 start_codon:yes stop_codon:yes gene_type:complete
MGLATAPALQAGAAVAGGVSSLVAAKNEKRRSEINAYVGETRAIQTGTVARQNLESELGMYRNVLNSGGGIDSADYDLLDDIRTIRGRERRINVQNEKTQANDWRMQGNNAMARGWGGFFSGVGKAAIPLSTIVQIGNY